MIITNNIPYSQEVYRKLLHLSSLWMPIFINYYGTEVAAKFFGALLLLVVAYDMLRKNDNIVGVILLKFTKKMLRSHELLESKFTGATYVVLAAFLVSLLFSQVIAVTALSVMLIADSIAALIGRKFGTPNKFGKSWLGTFTFLIVGVIIVAVIAGWFLQNSHFVVAGIIGVFLATILELLSKKIKIDDNLSITLTVALVLQIGTIL